MSVSKSSSSMPAKEYRLKVSRYDRASGMLLAWVILLGVIVVIMLVIWWTNQIKLGQAPPDIKWLKLRQGGGPLGGNMKLAGAIDEKIELMEASAEVTLAAIANAVSTKVAVLDDPSLSDPTGKGRGDGGRGIGDGPGRGIGPGPGIGIVRPPEFIMPEGLSLDAYARVLDGLDIELGVVLPGNKVQYVKNLSSSSPITRIGPADRDLRYHLAWRSGELQQADRDLFGRAGIDPGNRTILQFLTPQREDNLVAMAKKHAKEKHDVELNKIRKTRYGVKLAQAGRWEFYVIDQLPE